MKKGIYLIYSNGYRPIILRSKVDRKRAKSGQKLTKLIPSKLHSYDKG